jgi:hypothetical protein
MKVTDEMVDAAIDAYEQSEFTDMPTEYAMKAALEAAMQAAWIKFDVDNKETWPPLDTIVMTNQGLPAAINDKYTWYLEHYALENQFVTHWMPLPEYKEPTP